MTANFWEDYEPEPVQDTEDHYKGVVEGVQKLFDDKRAQPAPVQEPVAWRWTNGKGWLTYGEMPHDRFESTPLYTTPPAAQRTWTGLTDVEQSLLWEISRAALPRYATYCRLVEAKLKERNQ
jgi:hypothetical protein